jgi:hypothetical protein
MLINLIPRTYRFKGKLRRTDKPLTRDRHNSHYPVPGARSSSNAPTEYDHMYRIGYEENMADYDPEHYPGLFCADYESSVRICF